MPLVTGVRVRVTTRNCVVSNSEATSKLNVPLPLAVSRRDLAEAGLEREALALERDPDAAHRRAVDAADDGQAAGPR